MKTIALKINVLEIDKNRLFEGKKGKYLDCILILKDETDQYGNNGMIVQSVSKEEREAGVQGNILGNCKVLGASANSARPTGNTGASAGNQRPMSEDDSDGLPF